MTQTQTQLTLSKFLSLDSIVAFHIGRGGQFYNAGHLTFLGEKTITDFTYDLFINFENLREVADKIGNRDNLAELLECAIGDQNTDSVSYLRLQNYGLDLGKSIYTDHNGNEVGLTVAESLTGIGVINQDGEYDTTYTCRLSDCNEYQLLLINKYYGIED